MTPDPLTLNCHEDSSLWHVVYTRPNGEKKTAMSLAKLGAQVYCPVVEKISSWSDRKKKILRPALPSMILVEKYSISDEDLFLCPGTSGFMSYKGKRSVVRGLELKALDNFIRGRHKIEKGLSVGQSITVPMLQKEGVVEHFNASECWVRLIESAMAVRFSLS